MRFLIVITACFFLLNYKRGVYCEKVAFYSKNYTTIGLCRIGTKYISLSVIIIARKEERRIISRMNTKKSLNYKGTFM